MVVAVIVKPHVDERLWSHPTCWRYINKSIIIIIIIMMIWMIGTGRKPSIKNSEIFRSKFPDSHVATLGLLQAHRCMRVLRIPAGGN